jgi:hypothetical protein
MRYGCKIINDTVYNDNDYHSFKWISMAINIHDHHFSYQAVLAVVIHAYAMICVYAIVLRINDALRTYASDILGVWVCAINGEDFVSVEVLIVRE